MPRARVVIRPLPAASEEYPALELVDIEWKATDGSGWIVNVSQWDNCNPSCTLPDLSTILTCDDPAEVGEMCEQRHVIKSNAPPDAAPASIIPVTARLFLWTGEPVEWGSYGHNKGPGGWTGILFPTATLSGCLGSRGDGLLTAVVMVSVNDEGKPEAWGAEEAMEACAEAGIPFIIPGDPERGRLEL